MIGAIIGDIAGSLYEYDNVLTKDFEFLSFDCFFTDDSVMTYAIAKALMDANGNYANLSKLAIKEMQRLGRQYPDCGFGANFGGWIKSNNPKPYNSMGNGAAMRVSPVGWVAKSLDEVKELSRKVT